MDRRTFLKKLAEVAGVSAGGITLSKLQIAAISGGLSSLLGCSSDLVDDPNDTNLLLAPEVCDPSFTCDKNVYNCGSDFTCVSFLCNAPQKFMCNSIFNICATEFLCPVYYHMQGASF